METKWDWPREVELVDRVGVWALAPASDNSSPAAVISKKNALFMRVNLDLWVETWTGPSEHRTTREVNGAASTASTRVCVGSIWSLPPAISREGRSVGLRPGISFRIWRPAPG